MREIRTFILRLLVDSDDPHVLRGALRPVDGDDERSFADERALLALLYQMGQLAEPSAQARQPGDRTPDQPTTVLAKGDTS